MPRVLVPFQQFPAPGPIAELPTQPSGSNPREIAREDRPIHGARYTYIEKLVRYRLLPIFVSPLMDRAMVDELFDSTHGLMLMGGTDFEPSLYGESRHPLTNVAEPLRDGLELYLLNRALTERKPTLGICRGHQALAVAAGGRLLQHIDFTASESPSSGDRSSGGSAQTEKLMDHTVEWYVDLADGRKHEMRLEPGTKLARLLGAEMVHVNSGHHQAVADPGPQLTVSGRAPDGIIEAIEHRDEDFFCFGLQCHPEAESRGALEPVFGAFAAACAAGEKPAPSGRH